MGHTAMQLIISDIYIAQSRANSVSLCEIMTERMEEEEEKEEEQEKKEEEEEETSKEENDSDSSSSESDGEFKKGK